MNDVNKVAARKLRSLAAAIRAERYAPHDFGVRDAMEAEAVKLTKRADELDPYDQAAVIAAWVGSHRHPGGGG